MSIRKRMLYLVLGVGLFPLIIVTTLYITSLQVVRIGITKQIDDALLESSTRAMQLSLDHYQSSLGINRRLANAMLLWQSREIQTLYLQNPNPKNWQIQLNQRYKLIDTYTQNLLVSHFTYLKNQPEFSRTPANGQPQLIVRQGKDIFRFSLPFNDKNGKIAGTTGFDVVLTDVFQWLKPLKEWEEGATGLLVYLEKDQITIRASRQFGHNATLQTISDGVKLESTQKQKINQMRDQMLRSEHGVLRMPYKNQDSLWVYSGKKAGRVYPIMIVPYKNIDQLKNKANDLIVNSNTKMFRYTTGFVLLLIIAVVILALRHGRMFTKPIFEIVEGVGKIADGNFDAQVNVKTGDELEKLGTVVNAMGKALKEGEKMRGALALASAIQTRLLPDADPTIPGYDIHGICAYCDETGGDYYDFVDLQHIGQNLHGITLGDVTGHGIGAALLMASARSHFRHYARHHGKQIDKVFNAFNNALYLDTEPGKFMSMFYAIIDPKTNQMNWISGGHDPAFSLKANQSEITELEGGGLLLGVVEDELYEQSKPYTFSINDIVVIGTDGIWEARNDAGQMYGKKRLQEVILKHRTNSAKEIGNAIVKAVLKYCGHVKQQDDITAVVIKKI